MSRINLTLIVVLMMGFLAIGLTITANSLEKLEGRPVSVWSIDNRSHPPRISLLGNEYDVNFFNYPLENSLNQAVFWCQKVAQTLNLPDIHILVP